MRRSILTRLHSRLSFYEWAYGRMAEADSDLGPIAEFLLGSTLNCLPISRTVNAPYDLILPDGRTIEVKATAKKAAMSGEKPPIYRWDVSTQFAGDKPLADLWFFFTATFPPSAATTPRFDVFDPRYWTVRIVPGPQLVTTGVTRYVTEKTLDNLAISPQPFATIVRKKKTFLPSCLQLD